MEIDKKLQWNKTQETKTLCKTRVFDVCQIESISPRGEKKNYIVMDAPEWGIIIPVLKKQDGNYFVMVKQWRHGSNTMSIEFPGGVMNTNEDPQIGVERELTEETGYTAGKITKLATLSPNPAIMSNRLHIFLAENLTNTNQQQLDEDEFVEQLLIPEEEVLKNMGKDPYTHAFMSAALFLYYQHRQ